MKPKITRMTFVLAAAVGWAVGCREPAQEAPPPKPAPRVPDSAPAMASGRPGGLTSPMPMDPHSGMAMPPGHPGIGAEMVVPPASAPARALRFTAPGAWKQETPSSAMRVAQYRIPRAAGDSEDGLVVVSAFPSMRGMTQMNVQRWLSQVTQPDGKPSKEAATTATMEVAGLPVTVLRVSGTYDGHAGYRMLAASIETPDGPWFVKVTGPVATISAHEAAFDGFIQSARY